VLSLEPSLYAGITSNVVQGKDDIAGSSMAVHSSVVSLL
jgi:hypothetical protein